MKRSFCTFFAALGLLMGALGASAFTAAERRDGGWRLAGIQSYTSGAPIALSRNNPLPIFNGGTRPLIDSYEDWRAPIAGLSQESGRFARGVGPTYYQTDVIAGSSGGFGSGLTLLEAVVQQSKPLLWIS